MNEMNRYFRSGQLPRLTMTHIITASHSAEHARLAHLHENELELFYVAQGSGEYMVGGSAYQVQRGDMVVCNAGVLHGEEPSTRRRILSYCISLTDVAIIGLPDNQLLEPDAYPVVSCGMLTRPIGEIMRMLTMLSGDLQALSVICDSLSCGVLLMMMEIANSHIRCQPLGPGSDVVARRIREYIDRHYNEPMSLAQIGETLHISESYLSHVFKKEYGESPMQYLCKRRLGEAQSLLIDTDLPIGDIADRFCYSGVSHFNTAFKKYVGMTPGSYRRSFQTMDAEERGDE